MTEEEIFLRTYRAKSWQKRARGMAKNGKEDLDGAFIFWWIAFKPLYGQPRERLEVRDRYRRQNIDELKNIKDFLQGISTSPHIKKALSDPKNPNKQNRDDVLENVFLRKETWNQLLTSEDLDSGTIWTSIEKTAESANKNLRNGQIGQYLKAIFEQLYVLRNQIIHGASKDQSRANRRSHTSAVPVLAELVPVFIKAVEDHGLTIESDGIPYSPFKGKKSSKHPPLEQDFNGPPGLTEK